MIGGDNPFAIAQYRVPVLHHTVGWKTAILDREIHRAAIERDADAELLRFLCLDIHGVLDTGWIQILMVARCRAAAEQEFGKRQPGGEPETVAVDDCRPHRIKYLQPVEQFPVDRIAMGSRQGLIEMMMGVDKAGQNDMAGAVDDRIGFARRLASCRDEFRDPRTVDH